MINIPRKHYLLLFLGVYGLFFTLLSGGLFGKILTEKPTVVFVDGTESYIVSQSKDKAIEKAQAIFIKQFFSHYLSYDQGNFQDRIDKAADFVSSSLWRKLKPEVFEEIGNIEKNSIEQKASLIDLVVENGVFKYTLGILRLKNGHRERLERQYEGNIVGGGKITDDNPLGFQIDKLEVINEKEVKQ